MVELLAAAIVYVVVVYPSVKVLQLVRRGEAYGMSGIRVVDD